MNKKFFNLNLKTIATLCLSSIFTISAQAQTNPQPGCVVTTAGDTLCGTIDYLGNDYIQNKCRFKEEGTEEFKELSVEEIYEWWLQDHKVYYVKKTYPIDRVEKTFFAEYLIKGEISLFHYEGKEKHYFFMEDQDGNVATVNEEYYFDMNDQEKANAKRKNLKEAYLMLSKSTEATKDLWDKPINSHNLTNIIRRYDKKYCTDSGECIDFKYDESFSKTQYIRPHFEVGMINTTPAIELSKNIFYEFYECQRTNSYLIGAGADVELPRVNKHFMMQGMVYFSPIKSNLKYDNKSYIKYYYISFEVAAIYKLFPHSRITPYIKGGTGLLTEFDPCLYKNCTTYTEKDELASNYYENLFIGLGIERKINKHYGNINLNYNLSSKSLYITAGFTI